MEEQHSRTAMASVQHPVGTQMEQEIHLVNGVGRAHPKIKHARLPPQIFLQAPQVCLCTQIGNNAPPYYEYLDLTVALVPLQVLTGSAALVQVPGQCI